MKDSDNQSPIPAPPSGKGHGPNHLKTCLGITKELKFCRKPRSGRFYCYVHRRQPLHFLVAAFLAIVFSYIAALIPLPWKTPRQKPPIVLSSDRVDLGSGTKKAVNNFFARNIGDVDLFQVTIKLLLDSTVLSVTNDDVGVEMINPPSNLEMPTPIPGDPFKQLLAAFHGTVIPGRDFSDREALFILIDHLPPKASAGFRIRNQSFKILPPGEHCLRASVTYYTNTLPATFMFDDGSPGFGSPRSDLMGMKSLGGGKAIVLFTAHTSMIDGADIVTNAARLIQAGKWDEAERELTRAIQQNPSLGVAYGNRAVVLLKKGRIEDAYQDSVKALSLLPDDPLAQTHVAQCLRFLGRFEESLTNYTRAIVLAGTNKPGLIYERGVVFNELNRPAEARRDFDQAALLGYTNEWVRHSKGVAFLKERSFSNAVIEFNAALTMQPDMADAHFALGLALKEQGQIDAAERHLREAIRLKPSLETSLLPK